MTRDEIKSVAGRWLFDAEKCTRSLYEISKVENPRQGGKTHCLDNKRAGTRTTIWFDEVMSEWTDLNNLRVQNKVMPHRIDGCYVKDRDIYLIEFKADGDWLNLKDTLWAKFHDSYSQLIGRGVVSIGEAQSHLYYIVVSSAQMRYGKEDVLGSSSEAKKAEIFFAITNPMSDYVQRPWKHPEIQPKAALNKLAAFSCQAIYTLSVAQFDRFVLESQWT